LSTFVAVSPLVFHWVLRVAAVNVIPGSTSTATLLVTVLLLPAAVLSSGLIAVTRDFTQLAVVVQWLQPCRRDECEASD